MTARLLNQGTRAVISIATRCVALDRAYSPGGLFMTEDQIRKVLEEHKAGGISSDEALQRLEVLPFEDLGFANIDHHRSLRQGFPEVIFGSGKTVEQVARIVESMYKHEHNILVTRSTASHFERVKQIAPQA